MEESLTFSELRKIQKTERRQEQLSELDQDFLMQVGNYLKTKKELSEDQREYKNARRVFRKILSLREDKIVKNARLSLKSNIQASEMNLLPREEQLFREMKQKFEEHRDRIDEVTRDTETGNKSGEKTVPENPDHQRNQEKEISEAGETDVEGSEKDQEVSKTAETKPDREVEQESEDSQEEGTEGSENESEGSQEENEVETGEEAKDGYEVVKITAEVPEFMGTDLNAYGPFKEGEEAELPDDNAEILVNRGNAERLS